MKRVAVFICLVVFLAVSSVSYADTPLTKFGRGLANAFTCPFEIVKNMSETIDEQGPIAGLTVGLVKGIYHTGIRALVAAYEVVTFPFPFPEDYKPILTDPEYFFEEGWWI